MRLFFVVFLSSAAYAFQLASKIDEIASKTLADGAAQCVGEVLDAERPAGPRRRSARPVPASRPGITC